MTLLAEHAHELFKGWGVGIRGGAGGFESAIHKAFDPEELYFGLAPAGGVVAGYDGLGLGIGILA